MKRVLSILMLLVFLASNTGIALSAHYCGGELSSISFISYSGHVCPCGAKTMNRDCCQDMTTYLKVKSDLSKAVICELKTPVGFRLVSDLITWKPISTSAMVQKGVVLYRPPPLLKAAPIYLLDCVFRI